VDMMAVSTPVLGECDDRSCRLLVFDPPTRSSVDG
jgi:hypothetical protein